MAVSMIGATHVADRDRAGEIHVVGEPSRPIRGTRATAYDFSVHDVADSALPPWQSGYRFLLELGVLTCWGIVGWRLSDGPARFALVAALPLTAAILWGTFRVPGDQSASGKAPVAASGPIRLLLEIGVLGGAAIAIGLVWRPAIGIVLGVLIEFHYMTSPRRVRWLLRQRRQS